MSIACTQPASCRLGEVVVEREGHRDAQPLHDRVAVGIRKRKVLVRVAIDDGMRTRVVPGAHTHDGGAALLNRGQHPAGGAPTQPHKEQGVSFSQHEVACEKRAPLVDQPRLHRTNCSMVRWSASSASVSA
jgi:hypothetical protein